VLISQDRLTALLREPPAYDVLADRFRIEREAGIGGMGIVYRTVDQTTGDTVAVKVLRKTDAASTRRFANEIEALESLADPAIVRYIAHGVLDDGQPYLAMEWIEGESLAERLQRGPLALSEVLALGARVASALHAAHARGVIHRDIKPGNVLLPAGKIEEAKVADFGLSRFVGAPHVTSEGLGLGTPGYAAPEQVRGEVDLDERADLFSLGCLLFRCLTNEEAFGGDEALTVIARLVLEEPPRARSLRADVPPDLDELIAQLLAKAREERPASAKIVMVALDRLQRGLPWAEARERSRKVDSQGSRWWAVAGLCALGMGIVAACFASRAAWHGATPATAVGDVTAAPSNPTLAQDLPVSSTCRAETVLDYREGLHALRDAIPKRAYAAFARGAVKDPACPEVLLRLLETASWLRPIAEQREHLRHALVYRDALSERDRVLLDALVAGVGWDPPDLQATIRIVADGARRFPNDAELAELAATHTILISTTAKQMEPALEFVKTATALDPSSGNAWLMRSWGHERLGQSEAQAEALAQCVKASPGAVRCIQEQINLLRRQGLCGRAEAQIRQWMARDPDSSQAYRALAAVVAAERASPDAIEEASRMRLAHMPQDAGEPAALREIVRLHDRAKLAMWTGDFAGAIRLGEELDRRVADEPHIEPHLRAASILVEARLETGRDAEAADLAQGVLRRKVAWTDSPLSGDRYETGAAYFEPILLGVAVEGGRLSPDAWRASARAWEQRTQDMNALEKWVLHWGSAVGAHIDAAEAIKNPPPETEDALLPTAISSYPGLLEAYEGRLRLLSGDAARALPLLQTATRSCQGIDQAFLNTRAHLWLGLAYEKLAWRREACDAYAVVARRWGKAAPGSVTAAEALKRSRALGCSG